RLALRFLDDVLHEGLGGGFLDEVGGGLRRSAALLRNGHDILAWSFGSPAPSSTAGCDSARGQSVLIGGRPHYLQLPGTGYGLEFGVFGDHFAPNCLLRVGFNASQKCCIPSPHLA